MKKDCYTCRYGNLKVFDEPCRTCTIDCIPYGYWEAPVCESTATEHTTPELTLSSGITLRDFFAAAALTGIANSSKGGELYEVLATQAYRFADAMLKKREDVPHVSGGEP